MTSNTPNTPNQARVLLDVFPAIVTVTAEGAEPRTVSRTRVVVTDSLVLIAADAPGGPMLIFREKHESHVIGTKKEPSSVTTVSGKVLAISKDDNCGCGSRLRSWSPYNTIHSSKDPTE